MTGEDDVGEGEEEEEEDGEDLVDGDLRVMKGMWASSWARCEGEREGEDASARSSVSAYTRGIFETGGISALERGLAARGATGVLGDFRDLGLDLGASREVRGQSASLARDTLIKFTGRRTMMTCISRERGDRARPQRGRTRLGARVPVARSRLGREERAVAVEERRRRGRRGGRREVPPVHRYVQSRLGRRRRVEGARRRRRLVLGLGRGARRGDGDGTRHGEAVREGCAGVEVYERVVERVLKC